MPNTSLSKLLFIVNPASGSNKTDWNKLISDYMKSLNISFELFSMPQSCSTKEIKQKVDEYKPDRVVAVGGDGTVKLVAESLLGSNIPLGILPAGSANGMAKEFKIPEDAQNALAVISSGEVRKIHMVKVNEHYCIHLSDIGFNAFLVKKFEDGNSRGFWGYFKAAVKVLIQKRVMQLELKLNGEIIKKEAAMVVIANATKFGTGAVINPDGKLNDANFEVVVVKKISVAEIFKMMVTHAPYNRKKTEVFQTDSLNINSKKKFHFQVDGEYCDKLNKVTASIVKNAIEVIVPTGDEIKSLV